jgi:hypothetical protein
MRTSRIGSFWFGVFLIPWLGGVAPAHQVSTAVGNGADMEMVERNDPTSARIGSSDLNTRWNAGDRNEVVGLRFDLSGYVTANMTNVTVNFVNYRDNATRYVDIYAVTPGAAGGTGLFTTETWADDNLSAWGDLPGLLVSDGTDATLSIDTANLTLLVDEFQAVSLTEGTVDSASSPELTAYIQNLATPTITLLVTQGDDNTSGGQFRFGSKEAASLTSIVGTNGQFASFLEFDLTTDAPDTTPPTVVRVSPTNGAEAVELDITVASTFDEAMDQASINTDSFVLRDALGNPVPATVTYSRVTSAATLIPDAFALQGATTYTATILGGPGGVADEAGNPLAADSSWSFTTRATGPEEPIRIVTDADTYLTNDGGGAGSDQNHGNKSQWEVRWYDDFGGTSRIHIGYLRFDISGVNPALFQTATLSGTFTDSSFNGPGTWNVYGLNDDVVSDGAGRLGNDWDETAVTFANAAGLDNAAPPGTFTILPEETTFLGTITHTNNDVQPLPFSSSVDTLNLSAFLAADTDGLVTLLLMSDTVDGQEYRVDTKEGSTSGGHRPATLDFFPGATMKVTGIERVDGQSIVVSWAPRANHTYGVERTADDLADNDWVTVATNLPGDTVQTYTDTAPAEPHAAYRVVDEGPVPPPPPQDYFLEDFETDPFARGWTVIAGASHQAGTDWEWGAPTSGPGSAQGGTGAMATNLDGDFAPNADISLVSPAIDLIGVATAALTFGNYYDCDLAPFDGCEVYLRDENGAAIPGLESPVREYHDFVTAWTTAAPIALPAAALDRTIRIEFRFYSDSSTQWPGWYIDNLRVGN